MIRGWGDAATRQLFIDGRVKGRLAAVDTERAIEALALLHASTSLASLAALRHLRLHKLKGRLRDRWAIDLNGPWRIVFRFENGEFHDVAIVDYH